MNLTAKTAAAALAAATALTAGLLTAAPATAFDGPPPVNGTISADSPAYLTNVDYGYATVNDANGIRWVTQYKGDQWHTYNTGPGNCAKSFNVTQKLGYNNNFTVTDCQGFKKSFSFKVVG